MKVCLITATKNRHKQIERLVRFALNQTHDNFIHLIYNNSKESLTLDESLDDRFVLVNNPNDLETGEGYKNLGAIYRDALTYVPEDVEVINFMDDDDVFLPDHIEQGLKGLEKGGKKAYKPQKSYYKGASKSLLVENVLEPSVFVYANHVRQHGFSLETTAQHLQWLNPLVYDQEIFVDPEGKPTYICDWSHDIPTYKTSGDPHNPQNFNNYDNWSQDKGDGIITPCSNSWAEHYYKV